MWAFNWDQIDTLLSEISTSGDVSSPDYSIEAAIGGLGGIYLGETNSNGELTHSFTQRGRHLLVAVKDGCWPGFARILIKSPGIVDMPDITVPVE